MPAREQFPIRTVSALTGVSTVTLRAWERRYGLLRPVRTPSGHRLYTHANVEEVRRVLALVERGIPVSRVRQVLDAEAVSRAPDAGGSPWTDYQDRMAAAIAGLDEQSLEDVYDEALSLHPIESVTRRVVLPLLERLGTRWQEIDGAIAEEHFFATYLRSKLGARLQHRMRYASGPRLVIACAPGGQHEVGLLLFALEARRRGLVADERRHRAPLVRGFARRGARARSGRTRVVGRGAGLRWRRNLGAAPRRHHYCRCDPARRRPRGRRAPPRIHTFF